MNEQHISTPESNQQMATEQDGHYSFGYYETIGKRPTQEDALAWHILSEKELTPENSNKILTPQEIGYRLWTTYQVMNSSYEGTAGTTASTTVFDGNGNLITATLGDAASFAAVYNKDGKVRGVVRLNSVTHKAEDESEQIRIEDAGDLVCKARDEYGQEMGPLRVNGRIAPSRAIGDKTFKSVTAEASIDITDMNSIFNTLKINSEDFGSLQVITTCDGFTDGGGKNFQTKTKQEDYLFQILDEIENPRALSEAELSKTLATAAIADKSNDNVSIAIQTIHAEKSTPFFIGVYDGHDGSSAAIYVAKNIGAKFTTQCRLTPEAYAAQKESVPNNQAIYLRDHPNAFSVAKEEINKEEIAPKIQPIITEINKQEVITSGWAEFFSNKNPPAYRKATPDIGKEEMVSKNPQLI